MKNQDAAKLRRLFLTVLLPAMIAGLLVYGWIASQDAMVGQVFAIAAPVDEPDSEQEELAIAAEVVKADASDEPAAEDSADINESSSVTEPVEAPADGGNSFRQGRLRPFPDWVYFVPDEIEDLAVEAGGEPGTEEEGQAAEQTNDNNDQEESNNVLYNTTFPDGVELVLGVRMRDLSDRNGGRKDQVDPQSP